MSITIVDGSGAALQQLSWSAGEISYIVGDHRVWQVDAHRHGHILIARADSQSAAWTEAARRAAQLSSNG